MGDRKSQQVDRIQSYTRLLQKQAGKAIRPYRADGYVNLLNRYGTSKDSSERYQFVPEVAVPDESLTMFYEGNGLFAKIIDAPAEEALKHGFDLDDVSDTEIQSFFQEALDELDWEETAMTAIKWARLFGGSIAVMLINDGRGLQEPLDWKNIKSIDDIRVYDRSVVQPDYKSMFNYDPRDPFETRGSRLGMPEFYYVNSRFGTFTVHESRCLVFQNGILPENSTNSIYQFWGLPEYIRIHRAIRDAEIAHRSAPKMLDKSVQPIYKMKDLAAELATEEGEGKVLRRLQTIDMARGMLNSITIDSEGEDYDFRTFQFSGVSDVINSACNYLSALTNIPQTILFGRSPAGMNATGESDLENWYSYVERIQKRMLKGNLRYLLSVVFRAGMATGEIDETPKIKIVFNPLWTMTESEKADLDQKKAQTELTKAQTVQAYMGMEVIDPTEVRRKLADSGDFDIDTMLDEYEDEEDLMSAYNEKHATDPAMYEQEPSVDPHSEDPGTEGSAPANAPAATKLPQDMSDEELQRANGNVDSGLQNNDSDSLLTNSNECNHAGSVGVLVVSDGKVLAGTRHNDFGYGLVCGPGGHIEEGETPEQAAFRETEEEFGISPKELIPLGKGPAEPDTGLEPHLFLCTEYDGEPNCVDLEISGAKFFTLSELDDLAASIFQPFADGLEILTTCIDTALFFGDDDGIMYDKLVDSIGEAVVNNGDENIDGGPGSGNHGHEGREGKIGGSAPKGSDPVPYSNKSEEFRKLISKRKENVMGFGMSGEEKAAERKLFAEHLSNSGAKISYNEEYDVYNVVDTDASFQENRELSICLNYGNAMGAPSRKEYIDACKDAGVEAELHEQKNELPEAFIAKSDGTPVYRDLSSASVLTNDELFEYSGTDEELNPEGHRAFKNAAERAISGMSKEEASAVHNYTSQYGVNYQRVNEYLNGSNPDDAEARKAAELMTTALDHEIGAPVTVYRGEQDLSHISDNPKLKTMLNKVARGDFSSAEKIKSDLEGREVTNPTVTSTSIGGSAEGFGKLPVQIIFKAPADAKGVDVTKVSAYGGGRSNASAIFGGSASYESELAFKPGMKYKIDRVDFNMTRNGKKQSGQVWITATVLTESNSDSSAVVRAQQ